MGRNIDIFNDVDGLMFEHQDICHLFECLDTTEYGIGPGDLSVVFLNKISMQDIHEQYLQDDTLTDVITFDGDEDMSFAGEICVSPDYAVVSSQEHNISFSEELSLYLVHGYLHLYGLNDLLPEDIVIMRAAEKKCMNILKDKQLLPKFKYIEQ